MLARLPLWCWFVVGAAAVAGAQAVQVGACGWNATVLLRVGEHAPARHAIGRDLPGLWLDPYHGHDGKYNYLVARHPAFWRADAETLAGLQDPGYRYTRPLYPLLAGLGGTLPPRGTLAGLILVQVLAGGTLAAALAAFARRLGLPCLFVAANLFNPGIFSSACLLTSDLTALALTLAGWTCAEARRYRWAAGLFALAVLAKEYYALLPLSLAASLAWERRWRSAAVVGVLPVLPVLAWKAAVTAVLGGGEGLANFTRPGGGIAEAAGGWDGWSVWVGRLGVVLVAASLAAAVSGRLPVRLRLACAAWGLLGVCASELVWRDPTDLLRAIAPAWWLATWAAFARFAPRPNPDRA